MICSFDCAKYNQIKYFDVMRSINRKKQYGYKRGEDTPVPIPNTEVKLFIADGT